MAKISIIGAGNLGAAIAFETACRGIADEIILVDILKDLAEGQAADMQQALVYKNKTKVSAGSYEKISGSDVIVITAGKPRTPEMKDRLQLAEINVRIIDIILTEIKKYCPEAILITLTNPMDIVNYHIYRSGFTRMKVIGSGGQLDSARLRVVLGYPTEVEAFMLGEHGEDQIPAFSRVTVKGESKLFSDEEQEKIKNKVKATALEVIQKKGATIFAPAVSTADMIEAIVQDQKKLMVCSVNVDGEYGINDVSLGLPVVLGKNGIERIEIWELAKDELESLQLVAKKLQHFYSEITTSHQQKLI